MNQIRIERRPPIPFNHTDEPRARPLTHHEILALMAPFSQRGRHADLAASQREERRLLLKPIEHTPTAALPIKLIEVLSLELPESGKSRLTRTLTDPNGLQSSLVIEGRAAGASGDLETLMEQIDSVPIERQFRVQQGINLARDYRIEPVADGKAERTPEETDRVRYRVVIAGAHARIHGIDFEMKADRFITHAVELRLTAEPGARLLIPEDLTAVIGWKWRPIREFVSYWRGGIGVQSREPARTADIERKLGRTVTHLAETLARSPAEFHARHVRARWRVAMRRALPLTIGLLILALTPAVQWLDLDEGSIFRMLIFHAPPIMLAALFIVREMPRIEIPPLPRPLTQSNWTEPLAKRPGG